MSNLESSALNKLPSLGTPIMLWRSCWPRQIYWTKAIIVMLITFTQAQFWLKIFSLRTLFWPAAWGQKGKGFFWCSSQPNLNWVSSFTQQRTLCSLFRGRRRSSRGAHAWCSRLALVLGWSSTPVATARPRSSPRQSLHTTSTWEEWTCWTRWLTIWQEKGHSTYVGRSVFFFQSSIGWYFAHTCCMRTGQFLEEGKEAAPIVRVALLGYTWNVSSSWIIQQTRRESDKLLQNTFLLGFLSIAIFVVYSKVSSHSPEPEKRLPIENSKTIIYCRKIVSL